jgi:hypothetical protein
MNQGVEVCPPAAAERTNDLDRWLGRREAFSLVAGRCSSADVECMKQIRDGRLYLSRSPNWNEFCEKQLHMSRSNVNHLIALREKFGAAYFHIAQITRISVADYRAIAPAVNEQGIEYRGEVIPLDPENAGRIAEAVAALRSEANAKKRPGVPDRLATLEAASDRLLAQLRELREECGPDNPYLKSSLVLLRKKVYRLSFELK